MRAFLKYLGGQVWRSIEVGWSAPTMTNADGELIQKPYERFSKKEKDAAESNDQALNAIFRAVDRNQFRLISNCTEAKRVWDIFLITHEGTTIVKAAKLQIVMSKIENLKMEDAESITNFHGRVREYANEAERLGEQIAENKLVLKVLRSLPEKYSMDVKAIRQTQSLNVIVDGDSDSNVDPKEMLIIVEEKFQESLRVNKKKCLENDSLKRELAESKRDVEQLIKELQRYNGKVTAEDDTDDDTEDDIDADTAEELSILQRKWVQLVQANQKTVLENHQLVAERDRLKENISKLEKKIEDLEGQQSDLKYELNQLKNFHKWVRSAGAKAIEEQVNVSKFYGDKTGLGFSGSESNKTPLDLFVDRRKEIDQKVPQGTKTEAAASAQTSSAKPAEASHEASTGTIYTAPYVKRQRVVTQSSMRRHKDHYPKPERRCYSPLSVICYCDNAAVSSLQHSCLICLRCFQLVISASLPRTYNGVVLLSIPVCPRREWQDTLIMAFESNSNVLDASANGHLSCLSISSNLLQQDVMQGARMPSVTEHGLNDGSVETKEAEDEEKKIQLLFQLAFDAYFETIFRAVQK
ncbi:unnamed protein product [Cuscuta campestris]|uniref:Gag-pol polyprotein n=1 Tax=Cuscuta campestris TaxID=132261 RepID=A0A484LSK5_9ASTE|nr:unnamed protein product [Cuscuta campestris]